MEFGELVAGALRQATERLLDVNNATRDAVTHLTALQDTLSLCQNLWIEDDFEIEDKVAFSHFIKDGANGL